jgi:translation initiation factor 2B subunit (eIF-2B alpha/beta/delta family)
MKINEVTSSLKTFIATVRIILQDSSSTAATSITAQSSSQAHMMLTRIYGRGNVMSVSQSVSEASETDQINAPASFSHQHRHRQQHAKKNAPAEFSCVAETGNGMRVLSPAELQVKSLSDKAKQINQQAKQLKARQSLAKAQEKLRQASAGPKLSA